MGPASQTVCTCRGEPVAGCLPPESPACPPGTDLASLMARLTFAPLCVLLWLQIASHHSPALSSVPLSRTHRLPSPAVPSHLRSHIPRTAQSQQSGLKGLEEHGLQPLMIVHDHSWPSPCTYYVPTSPPSPPDTVQRVLLGPHFLIDGETALRR